jgi:hypothetical protein
VQSQREFTNGDQASTCTRCSHPSLIWLCIPAAPLCSLTHSSCSYDSYSCTHTAVHSLTHSLTHTHTHTHTHWSHTHTLIHLIILSVIDCQHCSRRRISPTHHSHSLTHSLTHSLIYTVSQSIDSTKKNDFVSESASECVTL